MADTNKQFNQIIDLCREIFVTKMKDYGTAWRILRPSSLTDQIFIKAQRIRSIETKKEMKVDEGKKSEFIGIINYAIMAIIQLEIGHKDEIDMEDFTLQMKDNQDGISILFLSRSTGGKLKEYLLIKGNTVISIIGTLDVLRINEIEEIMELVGL